jgi:hypothetical protein
MPMIRNLFLFAAPILAGCAAVTSADGRRLGLASAEFRSYVEQVFRDQNRVASELAFAIEESPGVSRAPGSIDLDAVEEALIAACAPVNELATARRDEQALGLRRSAALAREAPACERATRAAQEALAASRP